MEKQGDIVCLIAEQILHSSWSELASDATTKIEELKPQSEEVNLCTEVTRRSPYLAMDLAIYSGRPVGSTNLER